MDGGIKIKYYKKLIFSEPNKEDETKKMNISVGQSSST